LPPSIQMSKPENNPMQDIMAGILMTCAMMTSGYLIIRRKGFTFSRCIGIVIFLWTISTISLAASFWYLTNSHQREYQRFQRSVEKLRSLNPDKVPVDNSDEP
jgi:ATP/ADP translocase